MRSGWNIHVARASRTCILPLERRAHVRDAHATFARRGFTLVELCLGLVITALVAGAVAAFSLAMARSWTAGEQSQALNLTAAQASLRMQHHVRDTKKLGALQRGWLEDDGSEPAAVLMWASDLNEDRQIQSNELELLFFDPAGRVIKRYRPAPSALVIEVPRASFESATMIPVFMAMAGPEEILARDVSGARFSIMPGDSAGRKPSLEYVLKLERASGAQPKAEQSGLIEYGVATLRGPAHPDEPIL